MTNKKIIYNKIPSFPVEHRKEGSEMQNYNYFDFMKMGNSRVYVYVCAYLGYLKLSIYPLNLEKGYIGVFVYSRLFIHTYIPALLEGKKIDIHINIPMEMYKEGINYSELLELAIKANDILLSDSSGVPCELCDKPIEGKHYIVIERGSMGINPNQMERYPDLKGTNNLAHRHVVCFEHQFKMSDREIAKICLS